MRSPTLQAFAGYLIANGYRQTTTAVVVSNLRMITKDGNTWPETSAALTACIQSIPNELRQVAVRNAWRLFASFQEQQGIQVPALIRESPAAADRRVRAAALAAAQAALPPALQKLRTTLLAPETRVTPTRLATWTWGMFKTANNPAQLVLVPPRETAKDIGQFILDRELCVAAHAAWAAIWGRAPTADDYLFSLPPTGSGASVSPALGTA